MGRVESQRNYASAAAPLAAALGCLQPGIDPVFLTLLSQAGDVPSAAHGIIVGGTQAGAALGSLAVWRLGALLPHRAVVAAAAGALGCSLATPLVDDIVAILPIRCCYGFMMGMVYAYTMASYAARRPNKAFGAVFLIQLLLSTLASLVLPELELALGAETALATLALVPAAALGALALMSRCTEGAHGPTSIRDGSSATVPVAGWALAAATFWFICSTMLVWSFSAGLATSAGIEDRTIGHAVAVGSIAGALTAFAVMREKSLLPLPVTAILAGLALASPIVLIAPGDDMAFVVSIILLNIGSTAIIIRCSGRAVATSADSRFRTFVACTHSLGLIAGPLLGTGMMALLGSAGLLAGVILALSAGLGAVILAILAGASPGLGEAVPHLDGNASPAVRIALD